MATTSQPLTVVGAGTAHTTDNSSTASSSHASSTNDVEKQQRQNPAQSRTAKPRLSSSKSGNESSTARMIEEDPNLADAMGDDDVEDVLSKAERKERDEALGRRETKAISYLRLIVMFVLVAVAASVSGTVYHYAKTSELERFQSSFTDDSTKVIDAFRTNAERRLAAIDSLSMAYTSYAIDSDSTWPNVTLPDYERKASRVMDLADVIAIFQFPLITSDTRAGWESYAMDHFGWLQDGLQTRQEEILFRQQQQQAVDGGSGNTAPSEADEVDEFAFIESYIGDGNSTPSIPSQIYQPMGAEVGPEDGPGPCKFCNLGCMLCIILFSGFEFCGGHAIIVHPRL